MCIAIYSPIGTMLPSKENLKNSFENNPDGAGFAYNSKGQVQIRKGFMTWESFWNALSEADSRLHLRDRGVLLHFRIGTHGGISEDCTHPFPLSGKEKNLRKTSVAADYAVIHNGIISLTSAAATRQKTMSDTMLFIRDYLTLIASNKGWFYSAADWKLIERLSNSKIAILGGTGDIRSTSGFMRGSDGNYYSNSSYKASLRPLLPYGCYGSDFMGEETYQSATEYEKMLKSVAKYYGYSAEDIDEMLADGFSMEEIEEMIYS